MAVGRSGFEGGERERWVDEETKTIQGIKSRLIVVELIWVERVGGNNPLN